jgi:hypothetical protein
MADKDMKPKDDNVHQGDTPDPSLASRDTVRFDDPDSVRAWLTTVRPLVDGIIEWGRDAAHPKRERVLSHWEVLRRIKRAARTLEDLFAAAERALDTK